MRDRTPGVRFHRRSTALVVALAAGGLAALQARVNADLASEIGSSLVAVGLLTLLGTVAFVLLLASSGLRRNALMVRRTRWKVWWFVAGALGAVFLVALATGVGVVGVALASTLTVAGQTIMGLLMDSRGVGSGVRTPMTARRWTSAAIAVGGLGLTILAVPTPVRSSAASGVGLAVLGLVAAGLGVGVQLAANGEVTGTTGDPRLAGLLSSVAGAVATWAAVGVATMTGTLAHVRLPSVTAHWELYLGVPFGVAFVLATSWAIRHTGVMLLALAVIGGQLVASLVLDFFGHRVVLSPISFVAVAAVFVSVVLSADPFRAAQRS